MRKIVIIAKREYRAMVATKAFVITLVLMPILMGGGIFFQERLRQHVILDEKRMVVLDQTGVLFKALSEAAENRNQKEIVDPTTGVQLSPRYRLEPGPDGPVTDQQRLELSARVRRGEIYPWPYLDAWREGVAKSPAAAVAAKHARVGNGGCSADC